MAILYPRKKVKNSLRLSVLDGSAWAAMMGLTQSYITPLALALKATTAQVGLLTSFPNFITALSQLASPNLSARMGSRKGLILPVVFLHALMWLPVLLVPFVFHTNQVWWLIVFIALSTVLGSLANPAWGSMMADLVPMSLRGRYFGSRGRITGIITLVFSLVGGGILEVFTGNIFIGFAILFGGAMICRLISFYFLSGMYEPPYEEKNGSRVGLLQIATRMSSTNAGKFTLYVSLIFFAANISSPFFAVYMLRDLNYSYVAYIINISFFSIATLAFQTYWGRRADWAGNIKVIRVTSILMPLVPIVWLFSSNTYYLIAAQILSGFVWAGFNLSSANFVYDVSEKESRTKYIAIYNAMTGLAICIGALIGGYIIPYLPKISGSQLLTLFLISGILRGLVSAVMLRYISEVRKVPQMGNFQFLRGRNGRSENNENGAPD